MSLNKTFYMFFMNLLYAGTPVNGSPTLSILSVNTSNFLAGIPSYGDLSNGVPEISKTPSNKDLIIQDLALDALNAGGADIGQYFDSELKSRAPSLLCVDTPFTEEQLNKALEKTSLDELPVLMKEAQALFRCYPKECGLISSETLTVPNILTLIAPLTQSERGLVLSKVKKVVPSNNDVLVEGHQISSVIYALIQEIRKLRA